MTSLTQKRADHLLNVLKGIERAEEEIQTAREELGAELAAMRVALGWNYHEAAAIIGCDRSNLSKLEKGKMWSKPLMERCIAVYRQH